MFLTHLIFFHIQLKHKGISTFEFLRLKENVTRDSSIVVRVNSKEQAQECMKSRGDAYHIEFFQQSVTTQKLCMPSIKLFGLVDSHETPSRHDS